jgi:hypothetical protein
MDCRFRAARRLTAVALVLAFAGAPRVASGDEPPRSKWSLFLGRGETWQEGSTVNLLHRGDHIGNALIGVAAATANRAGVGYQAWSWISFDLAFARSNVRMGSDFIIFENVDLCEAVSEEVLLTIVVHSHDDLYAHSSWRVSYEGGLVAGLGRLSEVTLLDEGRDSLGVERLETHAGFVAGFAAQLQMRIAHTGWALGLEGAFLGGGPKLSLETDPNGPYESGAGKIAPEGFGVRLRYRFR